MLEFCRGRGNRLCGGDEGAFRSPPRPLRFDTPILLGLSCIGYNQKTWHGSAENSISKQDESTRKGERFALLFCCVLLYKWRFWAIKTRINQHCFVEIVQRCKMTKKHSFLFGENHDIIKTTSGKKPKGSPEIDKNMKEFERRRVSWQTISRQTFATSPS